MTNTSGPWEVCFATLNYIPVGQVNGPRIAHVLRKTYKRDTYPDCHYNANLIAAAPDLMKALEGVMETLQSGEEIGAPESYCLLVEDCRKAIRKAKGIHDE